jgi:hypothetical protein
MIPTADALVTYLKDFTGSTNEGEIKQCVLLAELALRNIELPIQRNDPESEAAIVYTDRYSRFPIPNDMNKPILFYQRGGTVNGDPVQNPTNEGPWIIYDRVGDRDILALSLIEQMYLAPINIPAVMRGKFSEVGGQYQVVPRVAEGTQIHLYYYKTFPLLFTPTYDEAGTQVGTVQMNGILATFPEGYIYGALAAYYTKRHSLEDAQMYQMKLETAIKTVIDQNQTGKWTGGTTRLTNVFSPRRGRTLAPK